MMRALPFLMLLLPGSPSRDVTPLFVQFGHSSPAMRSTAGQVSTKVASEGLAGNEDHFGLRFKDVDNDADGFISGNDVALDRAFRIVFRFDRLASSAEPGVDFDFLDPFSKVPLPIDVLTGEFQIAVPLLGSGYTPTGALLRARFHRNEADDAPLETICFSIERLEVDPGPGEPPAIGWNRRAKWWLEDR
ncbi:MAG: hypothetical protein GY711_23710 [bacterium]|nr:hypothetical protein [bacterium]